MAPPRRLLKKEFEAIIAEQVQHFPKLKEAVNGKPIAYWLLYGDTCKIEKNGIHHVFYKSTDGRNPGVFSLRWPRFDNRGPGLDSLQPIDDKGRPLHVVRKNKNIYKKAQWKLAVENFRVLNIKGEKVRPDAVALARLHEIWLSKKKKTERDRILAGGITETVKISEKVLETWIGEMRGKYALIEGQEALEPATGKGRARYSSPTLSRMLADELIEPPQHLLVRPGEKRQDAINRFLTEIKHPLVRHRLALFRKLLVDLVKCHGTPDLVIVEAVRSLAMGRKAKSKYLKELKARRDDRASAYQELKKERQSTSKQAILRYRLWRETASLCPFCGRPIEQAELYNGNADIAHIYPHSLMECNEFYNLTIAHASCNRMEMQNKIPRLAFPDRWPEIEQRVRQCFKRPDQQRKLQLFLSETNEDAAQLVESNSGLAQTAYIAKMLRRLCLIELGWTTPDGRDPSDTQGNIPSKSFLVSNGALTSRFRETWGLNEILHPSIGSYSDEEWSALSEEAKVDHKVKVKVRLQKNRNDNRQHALDAIVISSTLPCLAYRVVNAREVKSGEPAWWQLDNATRRSVAHHPLFKNIDEFRTVVADWMSKVSIRSYISRSSHHHAYNTTIYAKKAPNRYVVRKVFALLSPKNIRDIFPEELAHYCQAAWELYYQENPDWDVQLKRNQGYLPVSFTSRLCFAHFQRWREQVKKGIPPGFLWPSSIQIPIKSVRLVSIKDDKAVMAASPGTHGFVERASFKEAHIYRSPDMGTYELVRIPYWHGDPLYPSNINQRGKPVTIIRKGQLIELKKPLAAGAPAGRYRVLVMGRNQVTILPHYLANTKEARLAYGFPKTGIKPYWNELIACLGYELPHHPSNQAEPAGATPA